jgi:hypothetical protein
VSIIHLEMSVLIQQNMSVRCWWQKAAALREPQHEYVASLWTRLAVMNN